MRQKVYKNKRDLVDDVVLESDSVLDVGFWGQGIPDDSTNWVHGLLKERAREVYGTDLEISSTFLAKQAAPDHYLKANAEEFDFGTIKFDKIISSELIEHLSNPGRMLDACRKHLKDEGVLILTTPNCFNLFNMAGKLSRNEPAINSDHTCYFNVPTLTTLLEKNGWHVEDVAYVYTLNVSFVESLKKKLLNMLYKTASLFTNKYLETLVVIARPAQPGNR